MKKENELPTVAIIGCGPRGLSALESLYQEAALQDIEVRVVVFEPTDYPGAGPVYNLNQPDGNWLNVSERGVGIAARKEIAFKNCVIPAFPNYQEWSGYADRTKSETVTDFFPLRSHLGKYLNERYESIANILLKEGYMQFVKGEVVRLDFEDDAMQIDVLGGASFTSKEAVLTIGHQPIELDEQMSAWQVRVQNLDKVALYTQPYPIERIMDSKVITSNKVVAIRGFGLATIDVLRALTEGHGGTFKISDSATREMIYSPSGNEPKRIIPFSLDGLPMAPKPMNEKIDRLYYPTTKELEAYSIAVKGSIQSGVIPTSTRFLMDAIAPLVVQKFLNMGNNALNHSLSEAALHKVTIAWLSEEDEEHDLIVSKSLPTKEMMRKFAHMASGLGKVSLDFCIGHVWRHCQPTMYKLLSFAPFSDRLIADIVALDERLKRYSYGPPLDSIQQVLALIESEIVDLAFVNDPKIDLVEKGWQLEKGANAISADVMINSVLDSPQITKVVSPLPKGLLNTSLVEPLHDKLGIRTDTDGLIEKKGDDTEPPLAVLGRLAKGTLIGVDAIAECFGPRSEYWAKGVVNRC